MQLAPKRLLSCQPGTVVEGTPPPRPDCLRQKPPRPHRHKRATLTEKLLPRLIQQPVMMEVTPCVSDLRRFCCWLRVENQLGFKMVKWIKAIEFVKGTKTIYQGEGGYNEDRILRRVREYLMQK